MFVFSRISGEKSPGNVRNIDVQRCAPTVRNFRRRKTVFYPFAQNHVFLVDLIYFLFIVIFSPSVSLCLGLMSRPSFPQEHIVSSLVS